MGFSFPFHLFFFDLSFGLLPFFWTFSKICPSVGFSAFSFSFKINLPQCRVFFSFDHLFSKITWPQCGVCNSQGLPNENYCSDGSKGITRDEMFWLERKMAWLLPRPLHDFPKEICIIKNKDFLHMSDLIGWENVCPSISSRISAPLGSTFLNDKWPYQFRPNSSLTSSCIGKTRFNSLSSFSKGSEADLFVMNTGHALW